MVKIEKCEEDQSPVDEDRCSAPLSDELITSDMPENPYFRYLDQNGSYEEMVSFENTIPTIIFVLVDDSF